MDRFTEWTGERWIAVQEKLNGKTIGDKDVYAKLAQYEDTGLTPVEAMKLTQVALGNTESVTDGAEMGELKSCPFCGGEVFLDDEGDFCMVCCGECGAGTTFAERFEDGTAGDMNESQSIKAWNIRTEFDRLWQENEQLKELLRLVVDNIEKCCDTCKNNNIENQCGYKTVCRNRFYKNWQWQHEEKLKGLI